MKDNPEILALVEETWKKAGNTSVQYKISQTRRAIVLWNKEQQRNNKLLINKWKDELEKAMTSRTNDAELLQKLNTDLRSAYIAEEAFWKQMSRNLWMSLGDRNSGFFHTITKGRHAVNTEKTEGEPLFTEKEITATIVNYFTNMFQSISGERQSIVAQALSPKIVEADNEGLLSLPTAHKVHLALLAIHPDKAPGPDGFSVSFFQANRSTVGPEIVSEIQTFFISGVMPRTLNHTHVRLIPKTTASKSVGDYRPIARCNVYYKIISKLLAQRLKQVLRNLISENQSAFVQDRAISDNILISHEVLHFLKTSEAIKRCSIAVKTDMSKAYDRLEWDFIEAVLLQLGFNLAWTNLIMQCIKTVTYYFLINGSAQGMVKPQKGIRQGDPLSPYIFILCSEVLSGLCRKLQGIRVATSSPSINHLLFC